MSKIHLSIIACASLLSACGGGGGSTADTPPAFSITSSSYTNNGVMPSANACAAPLGGADKSPQLSLTNLPSNTSKLAIVMDDEVSPCGTGENACVHWAVFNLPSTKTTITEGENLSLIAGVTYGETYDGASIGYAGACPPSNHVYKLTVYALNASTPNIPQNAVLTRSTFASTYGANILGQATWTGKYPN